jgi:tRNA threonylcarbamoyladenosine modification (KEOPS) complex  Pcc1 subunit
MISFKEFTVESALFNSAAISWELNPTHTDLDDFEFVIYKGESGTNMAILVTLPPHSSNYSDATIVDVKEDKGRIIFYKVVATNGLESYSSDVKSINELEKNKIALEIARKDNIAFKNVLKNWFYLLKVKTTGTYCSCYDTTLGEKVIPGDHLTCYNTQWVGGYYLPYKMYGNIGTFDSNVRAGLEGNSTEQITQLITGPFPKISVNDVIVDQTGVRWRVGNVKNPKSKMYLYRQQCTLQAIDRSDIVFSIQI